MKATGIHRRRWTRPLPGRSVLRDVPRHVRVPSLLTRRSRWWSMERPMVTMQTMPQSFLVLDQMAAATINIYMCASYLLMNIFFTNLYFWKAKHVLQTVSNKSFDGCGKYFSKSMCQYQIPFINLPKWLIDHFV